MHPYGKTMFFGVPFSRVRRNAVEASISIIGPKFITARRRVQLQHHLERSSPTLEAPYPVWPPHDGLAEPLGNRQTSLLAGEVLGEVFSFGQGETSVRVLGNYSKKLRMMLRLVASMKPPVR